MDVLALAKWVLLTNVTFVGIQNIIHLKKVTVYANDVGQGDRFMSGETVGSVQKT